MLINDASFLRTLDEADRRVLGVEPTSVPSLFEPLPLDVFGGLLLNVPERYPNLRSYFPTMPPDHVQQRFTGGSGVELLRRSCIFVKSMLQAHERYEGVPIQQAMVLDYGFGWGRLIRLLYRFVPWTQIYGVDPEDDAHRICRDHGVRGNLAKCKEIPEGVPFEESFDLIFAFSVLTHLSERCHLKCWC